MKPEYKKIKLGKFTIKYHSFGNTTYLHINLGRYKKGSKGKGMDTWTLYDGIQEKHKCWDDIWADFQNKKLVGVEIHRRD